MEGLEFIAPMMLGLGLFTMIGWMTHVIVDGRRRRERLKVFTDFHAKLIDRLGSAREFGDFLQSDGGQRFLATLSTEKGGPQVGIMRSMHTGVIMLALSIGLLSLTSVGIWGAEGRAFVLVLGVIVLSLAIGFLLSAGVSWRLARALGVMQNEPSELRGAQARQS
jgi:hypothetical protein